MNRRKYLTAVGTAAFSTKLPTIRSSSEFDPTEFLAPSTEIPAAFTRGRIPLDVPFFERLRSGDELFADAEMAARVFWAGGSKENPEWVLTTSACVAPDEGLFDRAVELTAESHHEFVDGYDEVTSSFWQFERQHEQYANYLEWSADIWIDELVLDGPKRGGERHVFTETMRLHARGPVFLWVTLFGPVDQSFQEWPYFPLLDRITEFQRTKLDAVSDEAIKGLSR